MFNSLFSNRYNKKREIFYTQYEKTRQRYPNLPFYKQAKEPLNSKSPKCGRQKRKPADYDYDEWIAGHFVSIVVRRTIEQWSCCQLMERIPTENIDVCSWRSWPRAEDMAISGPRRSLRLADRPNLSLKHADSSSCQLDTNDAIKWQQQLPWPTFDSAIKDGSSPGQQALTFTDDCQHESGLQCNMCCQHFGQNCDLQLHSLDDCRKYLLATLAN